VLIPIEQLQFKLEGGVGRDGPPAPVEPLLIPHRPVRLLPTTTRPPARPSRHRGRQTRLHGGAERRVGTDLARGDGDEGRLAFGHLRDGQLQPWNRLFCAPANTTAVSGSCGYLGGGGQRQ
jgi:hypothetical protein